MNILRTKSIEQSIKDTEEPEFQLRNKTEKSRLIMSHSEESEITWPNFLKTSFGG